MPPIDRHKVRDYGFADRAVALRKRAGLTQREVAEQLGVSVQAVHTWEGGLSYPETGHLKSLLALYLERGALEAGREEEEAAALWASVRAKAARHTQPFDPIWFATLPGASIGAGVAAVLPPPAAAIPARQDWGDAPAVPVVRGRTEELATLARWVRAEDCHVVEVLGAGGIGKTTVAARLTRDLAPEFATVFWRSLRNAPPVEEWLAGAIAVLSGAQALPPKRLETRLAKLLELLRDHRALLVLDNLETVLEPGAPEVRYRVGYEGYGAALARLAEGAHQGCVLLTSREQPLAADDVAVRTLHLKGLGVEGVRALLGSRLLTGNTTAWQVLVEHYGGNPLALRVVGETIGAVFGGDISAFLAQEVAVYGGIRQLLEEQVARLSALERSVLTWLAVEREPVGFTDLVAAVGPEVARAAVVEAVEALRRRSLLEWGPGGTFTLQPVVLEHVTAQLVAQVSREVLESAPSLLVSHALVKAQAKDYVRRSQERLIAQPLLAQLRAWGGREALEQRLLALLEGWRSWSEGRQGYGPGNVINLLRLLRGDLRGLDLSRLSIRQAYLQGVEAQDASLAGSHLAAAVLAEAFDFPTGVALSADGAYLAAGTSTGEVRLWRVGDHTPLMTARGHSGGVRGVALSEHGQLVASGSYDGTVRLWEAPSGRLLATLQGHRGGVWGVALSADGRLLASGSQDRTVRLWEAGSGQLLATLQGHTGGVWAVALSADGRLLASGSQDRTVRLWQPRSGQLLATLLGHTGGVQELALSADGRLLASGSDDGTVRLWEAPSGRLLAILQGHTGGVQGNVWGVAVSGDADLLASGSFDGSIRLWEAHSGRLLAILQGHSGGIRGVALSADGRLVASGSLDGTVRLWEARSRQQLATLQGHTSAVLSVGLSGDGGLVAGARQDGKVTLWEASSGRRLTTLAGHTGGVRGVALSGDGRLMVSGGFDGSVRLWETESKRLLAALQGDTGVIWGVALSGDGRLVASGSSVGTVTLWATQAVPEKGQPRATSASTDGVVPLWEPEQGRLLATLRGHTGVVYAVALSMEGQLLASGGEDGTVRLWEAWRGQPLATLQGHSGAVWAVALSADGRLVASGSFDGTIRLWEAPSGRLLATLQEHSGAVWGVALSGDGRLVASGSQDGTIRLWEAPSGRLLATLQEHSGAVWGVALSADGRLVASGSFDGAVKFWEASTGSCLRTLRADRCYERMDISGLTGVTEAQRTALLALGAIDRGT
jgi:WD40 repeat protein/transcriptional regulator with XRE-family HTH domain